LLFKYFLIVWFQKVVLKMWDISENPVELSEV
jgi:hypothetical protein